MTKTVCFTRVHADARTPTYATKGAACFDLYAVSDADIEPKSSTTIHTGIAVEVPEGHVMLAFSRSGHGFKHGVRLGNCTGVIDSDYRGELMVNLRNDSRRMGFRVTAGDRIAQALILPVEQVTFKEVSELSTTERGAGGFGSTGA